MAPSLSLLICDLGVMTHPSQGGGEIWRLAPARQRTSVEPLSGENVLVGTSFCHLLEAFCTYPSKG